MRTTLSNSIRFYALLAVGIFILSVMYLHSVYASLTVAFVLAYLLEPIVEQFERLKIPRSVGALLTLVIFSGLMVLLGILVVPKIIEQGWELFFRLPKAYQSIVDELAPLSVQYLGYDAFTDINQMIGQITDPTKIASPVGKIIGNVFTTTFGVVTTVLGFLIVPLMSFWLLREFPGLRKKLLYLVPKRHYKMFDDVTKRLEVVFGGFIRGQLVVSTILSAYYCLTLGIAGIELWLVLGLMGGFFNIIPYLGILTVITLTMITAFIQGVVPSMYIVLLCIFGVGMAMEGSVLTPKIVGSKVGLSPLVLIVALLCGGKLLGVVGMLLAIPTAAIGKVFLDVAIQRYRNSADFKRA